MDKYKIIQVKGKRFRRQRPGGGPGPAAAESRAPSLLNLMSLSGQRQDHHPTADRGGLKDQLRMGVMEADIDSDVDAAAMA